MENKKLFSYYVQSYFSIYLPNIRNNSSNTIQTYKYLFLDFLKFLKNNNIDYKNMIMKDFKIDYIEKYIEDLKKRKNSISTINLKIVLIKNFFNYLNYETIEYMDIVNKINKIRLVKKDFCIPKYLIEEEINIILNYRDEKISLKEHTMFIILYYGGLRVSEICNLKKEDISIMDASSFKIKIYNSKNNKNRVINFECHYGKYIKEYLISNKYEKESYLFINKYGKKYTKKGVNYIINKIYRLVKQKHKNELLFKEEKIYPHMLRHSRAMIMLKSGNSLSEIKEYLGHSNISTTEIYARLDYSLIKDSIENYTKTINFKTKYTIEEKNDLEKWLRNL
jgi:integrase/recombinase XerD